jgi:hypothetical protein
MTVLVTLTLAGADTGPFDIYSDADGYTTPLASGISKAALQAGYTLTGVPDGATIIRVTSLATCTNSLDMLISGGTTTTTTSTTSTSTSTSTTTTTTTVAGPVEYTIDNSATGSSALACAGSTTTSLVYALPGYTVPIVTMIFYDSPSLTTPFVGSVGWRKLTRSGTDYAVEVDVNGELINYVSC